jgi:prepilin-type N-terminal cleavage/methylation domain-containing protein
MKNRFVNKSDSGFTLIELLVVILIIAILAAVGIVALLGAIKSGQDSAAKQTATNAYKEVVAGFISEGLLDDNGGTPLDPQETVEQIIIPKLNRDSKDLDWSSDAIAGDPTNKATVGFIDAGFGVIGSRSKSGKCFYKAFLPLEARTAVGAAPPNKVVDSVDGECDPTPEDYLTYSDNWK